MSKIEVAYPVSPGTVDTPLDPRTRIASLADVGSIELPFIGMIFYSLVEEKSYIVKSLQPAMVGPVEVEKMLVGEYEPVGQGNDREHRFSHADIDVANRTYTISGTAHVFGVIDETGRQYPFALDEVTYGEDSTTVSLAAIMTYRNLVILPGEWQLVFTGGTSGKDGRNFEPDAKGLFADRTQYNNEAKGFSFLDFEAGIMYFKKSGTSGDWTDGFPVRGQKGDEGKSGGVTVVKSVNEPENPINGMIWIQE